MSSDQPEGTGDDRSITPDPESGQAAGGASNTRPTGGPVVAALEVTRRLIDRVLAALCIAIFAALVIVVAWQVFSRQVLGAPATWTEESARYVFVVLALLGAALVFSERGHIAVELLVNKFATPVQKIVALAVEGSIIFFAGFVMIYGGLAVAANAWTQNISTMPVSVGQVYLILPVVGALIIFFALCHIVGMFAGTEKPVPEIDENNQGI
ncbi:TRAP transporter small permease [uncultured Arthrobacter sp.]|uniref:TRAP transporter small permease n=1 Tax=uncultured Arthrobacter sp. TaxID=114050 RepID=UPI0026334D56|nr:TRAP transporter small permease [uncultured Arthrobacter sp.]